MSFFYIENKHIINSSNNEIINVEYYFFEVIITFYKLYAIIKDKLTKMKECHKGKKFTISKKVLFLRKSLRKNRMVKPCKSTFSKLMLLN